MPIYRKRGITEEAKNRVVTRILTKKYGYETSDIDNFLVDMSTETTATTTENATLSDSELEKLIDSVNKRIIDFFSEFSFAPSTRFVNTMAFAKEPKKYVYNYFRLCDNSYQHEISEKIKSPEFDEIICDMRKIGEPKTHINNRIRIWEGVPGSGKTTKAMELADVCVICSSDMTPSDLMQDFDFDEGDATFHKSAVWRAMESGDTVLLDEINLLPMETIRFLQGLTDNKDSIEFKGHNIVIHPDFNIIGTMNLFVNGIKFPMCDPIIDRCSELREFTASPKMLRHAFV